MLIPQSKAESAELTEECDNKKQALHFSMKQRANMV